MKQKNIKTGCRVILILILLLPVNLPIQAQDFFELPLWPDKDISGKNGSLIRVYIPENPNGTSVIACPGGGYRYLEMDKEGYAFASWFNKQGITFIVLKYRLPAGNPEIPIDDAKQAVRMVRSHAEKWNIRPDKIGIMGSSAGGHLASTLATHFDTDTRPAFQILLYPVITMDKTATHAGSRDELLGEKPSDEIIRYYSNETQVTPQTPPAFIVLSDNDHVVPSVNSVNYYLALNKNKVSAEMHVYPRGGHGWAMHTHFEYYSQWTKALEQWIKTYILPN